MACARRQGRLLLLAVAALVVASELRLAGATGAQLNNGRHTCKVPQKYTQAQYAELQSRNCDKVDGAIAEMRRAAASGRVEGRLIAAWNRRARLALSLCEEAANSNSSLTGAYYAVNAWSEGIMGKAECCNLVHPPYCLATQRSLSTLAVGFLVGLLLLVFAGTALASCLMRPIKHERHGLEEEPGVLPFGTSRGPRAGGGDLAGELGQRWLGAHCLRALPGAGEFARASADIFAGLHGRFDFQVDSARNQYEHLLSLWRSHCATVADRAVQEGAEVDEDGLLSEALGDMHAELLEGFHLWRERLQSSCVGAAGRASSVVVDGAGHGAGLTEQSLQQLAEVAAFLLVWGEAGNVRFMPEVLYFVTESVLAADGTCPEDHYGGHEPAGYGPEAGAPFRSGLFLAKVVRPIYNVIFDEWYDHVEVDKKDGRDVKKLRQGFETYLPPDVANYDDWNELFCDTDRLAKGLILDDGTKLFDRPREKRFAVMHKVDWASSLDRYETKTHREVHSLWGVFASTHRIWLLHLALFLAGVCIVSGDPPLPDGAPPGRVLLQGNSAAVRFAGIGLVVPLQGLLWTFARWETTSQAAYRRHRGLRSCATAMGLWLLWALPLLTYAAVRYVEVRGAEAEAAGRGGSDGQQLELALGAHAAVSVAGLLSHLLAPSRERDRLWPLTRVPVQHRVCRYLFWVAVMGLKFAVALTVLRAVAEETITLDLVRLGREPLSELSRVWYSTSWGADVLEWLLLWSMSFFLFVADTGVWYQVGCTVLGVGLIFGRRHRFAIEDGVAKIPERFSQKVLPFSCSGEGKTPLSAYFPTMWDRIIEHMRYEDKCDSQVMKNQSFHASGAGAPPESCPRDRPLRKPGSLGDRSTEPSSISASQLWLSQQSEATTPSDTPEYSAQPKGISEETGSDASTVKLPELFHRDSSFKVPVSMTAVGSAEMQWRINSLARCLGMPMPQPFRAPYIPGITVLIPHFNEDIISKRSDLFNTTDDTVPLMDWVHARYADEFDAFSARMRSCCQDWGDAPSDPRRWGEYSDLQWDRLCMWASMRLQTLWRTVAGMSFYQAVLQCHYEAQADTRSALAQKDVWNPSDCFTCLVSMQLYRFFSQEQLQHTNRMLETFPDCLSIAYIDCSDKNVMGEADAMHPRQKRRYFSCLIDRGCPVLPDRTRAPRLRVELPGFPILGDGKSDNQNHAIPFMRGAFCQCIDSNQGAYFEQMLLLPCVLGEFRTRRRGESQAKRIIGLPEHITSDFGSVGDFAAGSELSFGTVLQRSHAVLGARMHYGHPDIMNKQYMMQQGGVSKATKTLNLSEDIFAGMDFKLRGNGRTIRHCEYFYLTKGRDLGFNAVMSFFSKISSGAGEQILTRQMFRLGQILRLPETLSFYYAHAGYYVTQAFVSWSMPVTVFSWLLVLASDREDNFQSFMNCPRASAAEAMAVVLSAWCSWVLLFFLVAQTLPLFTQVWMEMGLKSAVVRAMKQWLTCSWCFFIFQAKLVGFYVMNEIRYGGATYVSTGRGLPTQRRPFIGKLSADGRDLDKVGGLYLDYAMHTYYDGMKLSFGVLLVRYLGGYAGAFTWTFLGLTIFSWLYAPFVFNPYQFSRRYFAEDLRSWWAFFIRGNSRHWVEWYDQTQLKPKRGFRHSVWDVNCVLGYFCVAVWFAALNEKLSIFQHVFSTDSAANRLQMLSLCPPIGLSAVYCVLATLLEALLNSCVPSCRGPAARAAAPASGDRGAHADADSDDSPAAAAAPGPGGTDPGRAAAGAKGVRQADGRRPRRIPLVVSTVAVVVLEFEEALAPLFSLHSQGWRRAFVSGLVLKLLLFNLVLFIAEGMMRGRYFGRIGALGKPLDLFVHANRMARDVLTSTFLFWTLAFGTLGNSLNEALCPAWNLHQLLVYRARPLRPDLA